MIRKPTNLAAILTLLAVVTILAGCASKEGRRLEAQRQFAAGQEHAFAMLQQSGVPFVRVIGPFQRPVLPWRQGMTLAHAILEAGYLAERDPTQIVIQRGPKSLRIEPGTLLQGEDIPVESGDVIHVFP